MTAGVDAGITAIVRPDGSVRVLYSYGDVVLDKVYNRADIDAFREKHGHGGDVPRAIAGISLETERLMKSQLDSWVANLAPQPGLIGRLKKTWAGLLPR